MTWLELYQEYLRLKGEKENTILLYQFDKRYWILGKDAIAVSNIFEVPLTNT